MRHGTPKMVFTPRAFGSSSLDHAAMRSWWCAPVPFSPIGFRWTRLDVICQLQRSEDRNEIACRIFAERDLGRNPLHFIPEETKAPARQAGPPQTAAACRR